MRCTLTRAAADVSPVRDASAVFRRVGRETFAAFRHPIGLMPRLQRRFLLHSRWTAVRPLAPGGEQHFEVVTVSSESVTLRAVLTRRTHLLTMGDLEDADVWVSGWRSLRED